jgi:glycoside/pentoside/hexuronide:cation symporter, GPH family
MNVADERLSLKTCLGFGVGTVGISIMLNTVTTYFPAFMSTVLGQSPELAGMLVMGSKLFDALVDLLIGRMSDHTRSKWGRRKPFLMVGAIISAASFLMLFAPPEMSDAVLMAYMIAALVLYSAGYSLFNVPYMALPAELTEGYHERTRLISFRTVFVSIGQLLGLAMTAALIDYGGGGARGYMMMGLIMALIIMGAMTATALSVPVTSHQPVARHEAKPLGQQLRIMWQNRPFMLLLGAKVFQFLSFASLASTSLLYLLNVVQIGYQGQILLSVVQNVVMALSMPLWVRIGRRFGKKPAYWMGVLLFCASSLSWLVADTSITTSGVVMRAAIAGLGSGALLLMSVSMLADTMAYDRALAKEGREGLLSSTIAVIEKVSFALGVAVLGYFLQQSGYVPTVDGALVEQPESAVFALEMGYAVIPSLLFIINGMFLLFYWLDEEAIRKAGDA